MKNIFIISIYLFSFVLNAQENTFMPDAGKYIVSVWVKEIHNTPVLKFNSELKIALNFGTTTSYVFQPSGQIIDNWQRIIGIIDIPDYQNITDPYLDFSFVCNGPDNSDCFFDDLRFFPYNGNMKSFVYDEGSQKLLAELDENNYATFYEYDLEGGLIRIKKETERGVFTIQETRSNNPKK